jgi:hypothetical protein
MKRRRLRRQRARRLRVQRSTKLLQELAQEAVVVDALLADQRAACSRRWIWRRRARAFCATSSSSRASSSQSPSPEKSRTIASSAGAKVGRACKQAR